MKTITFLLFTLPFFHFTINYGQQKAKLQVSVTDFANQPLKGEQILFVSQNKQYNIKGISSEKGIFFVELPGGNTYDIKIKSVGDATDYNTIEIPSIGPNEMYGENQMQIMIEQPKQFTLNNVLFETGKSTLKSSSYKELDELVELLKLKPELNFEIAGHTDNIGQDEDNLKLSENRAKAVMSYLIKSGINQNRMIAKGYGSSQPIADNNQESGRKLNRRTEIRIKN